MDDIDLQSFGPMLASVNRLARGLSPRVANARFMSSSVAEFDLTGLFEVRLRSGSQTGG